MKTKIEAIASGTALVLVVIGFTDHLRAMVSGHGTLWDVVILPLEALAIWFFMGVFERRWKLL